MLNGHMIGAAVLAWLIVSSLGSIKEAYYHRGNVRGVDEDDNPRLYSEAEYKRREYVSGGFRLILGLVFWYLTAKDIKDAKKAKESRE